MGVCKCPIHWVVCFRSDCPRARQIRDDQDKRLREARRIVGDPFIGVSGKATP